MLETGWGTQSIVPDRPAMLQGQMHTRVARGAMDPLTVTALALRGTTPLGRADCALLVSCDLAMVTGALQEDVRQLLAARVPDLPGEKLVLAATHTHTSLVFEDIYYPHPGGDVMTAAQCHAFLAQRLAAAAEQAWRGLAPRRWGRAFGHAVVGHNRRAVYTDGHAQMYGRTGQADFAWMEGYEDHAVDLLFAWDEHGALEGVVLDIPCPAQVDEGLEVYSADYWHEVRLEVQRRLGAGVRVLPLCGASGDQSPHFLLYGRQEEEMRRRRGVTERQEIALRVADAVERALECTVPWDGPVPLAHSVERVSLSPRRVSARERDFALAERQRAVQSLDPQSWWPHLLQRVADIHEGRVVPPPVPVELHALRLGDAALVTNPFELYLDYGLRMKTRSRAAQTLVVQLAGGCGLYLPTARAVEGGGYGAMPAVSSVGPEGGQELVEHTLAAIDALFPRESGTT